MNMPLCAPEDDPEKVAGLINERLAYGFLATLTCRSAAHLTAPPTFSFIALCA